MPCTRRRGVAKRDSGNDAVGNAVSRDNGGEYSSSSSSSSSGRGFCIYLLDSSTRFLAHDLFGPGNKWIPVATYGNLDILAHCLVLETRPLYENSIKPVVCRAVGRIVEYVNLFDVASCHACSCELQLDFIDGIVQY